MLCCVTLGICGSVPKGLFFLGKLSTQRGKSSQGSENSYSSLGLRLDATGAAYAPCHTGCTCLFVCPSRVILLLVGFLNIQTQLKRNEKHCREGCGKLVTSTKRTKQTKHTNKGVNGSRLLFNIVSMSLNPYRLHRI